MNYAIAVIDIGMTNKKISVYDDSLRQLNAEYRTFEPKIINGLQCHDLEAIESWLIEQLAKAGKQYPVRAIAISTHGATFVCIGKDAKPVLPCVYYTHEPGKDFHRRFYERFGSPIELQRRTGTPAFDAMINLAKGIVFAKEQFPEAFQSTNAILPYPQYLGFRLTGSQGVESTCMGCHTYLWDQLDHCLSSVSQGMGIASLLPDKPGKSFDVLGTISAELAAVTGLEKSTLVTMGIHDSNASLLPHFAKKGETGFAVNSTGTWCVMMHPVKEYGFTQDELGKVVFFNISAFGTPVKTTIFLGGQEFETWSKVLMALHKRQDVPTYDEPRYRNILQKANCFLLPELLAGTGQFPGSNPRIVENSKTWSFDEISHKKALPPCFEDYEEGFAVLQISLVMQSLVALERTGLTPETEIITEGGFKKNDAYNQLLSSAFKDNKVYLTSIAEATALGAAMTAKIAITGKSLAELANDFEVDYKEVKKSNMPELFSYRKAWMKQVAK